MVFDLNNKARVLYKLFLCTTASIRCYCIEVDQAPASRFLIFCSLYKQRNFIYFFRFCICDCHLAVK